MADPPCPKGLRSAETIPRSKRPVTPPIRSQETMDAAGAVDAPAGTVYTVPFSLRVIFPEVGTENIGPSRGARFDGNDLGLLCVVVFWGVNLTVVKFALHEMLPLAFNGLRFTAAAV